MESVDIFDLKPLDPHKLEVLTLACREMGISETAIHDVVHSARMLRDFEAYVKPNLPTKKAKADGLKEIAKLSQKLRLEIENVSTFDKLRLHQKIEDLNLPDDSKFPNSVPFRGICEYIENTLKILEGAATDVRLEFYGGAGKGGRKAVFPRYYEYIEWIWDSVKDEGFVVGRNNKFEKLCDAVFVAAGVPAKAAGAVRFFDDHKESVDAERAADW